VAYVLRGCQGPVERDTDADTEPVRFGQNGGGGASAHCGAILFLESINDYGRRRGWNAAQISLLERRIMVHEERRGSERRGSGSLISEVILTPFCSHLISAFQPRSTEDGDARQESNRLAEALGSSSGSYYMKALIYKEAHREAAGVSEATDVVHEIGHLFQLAGEDFHNHAGVMAEPAAPGRTSRYAPETLERIRSRNFDTP